MTVTYRGNRASKTTECIFGVGNNKSNGQSVLQKGKERWGFGVLGKRSAAAHILNLRVEH
jgi:hypothetical protein